MVTAEERKKILEMLEAGKLSAEEAANLLRALGKQEARQARSGDTGARWLRVRVTELDGGEAAVNVNLPMSLVSLGLRLGARFVPEMEDLEYRELVEALRQGATGKIIDVVDEVEGKRVEIYVE